MKAIFSFWSKPVGLEDFCGFRTRELFEAGSALSVRLARQHFDSVELVTDSQGAALFRDLNLPFDRITTDLDSIAEIQPKLWSYGKVKACAFQDGPFAHLDFDVFLKAPIDFAARYPGKALLMQSWELAPMDLGPYARAVRACEALKCPEPPAWNYRGLAGNAGVLIGMDRTAIDPWLAAAQNWVEGAANRDFWSRALYGNGFKFCIAFEQYLPLQSLPAGSVGVLVDDRTSTADIGFAHYLGASKRKSSAEKKILDHFANPRDYSQPFRPTSPRARPGAVGDLDEGWKTGHGG